MKLRGAKAPHRCAGSSSSRPAHEGTGRQSVLAATLVAAAGLAWASPCPAFQRVVRLYDELRGLSISETSTLAQDSLGFIWVGTIGGVFRFDGREFRRWAPDSVRHVNRFISTGPGGEVVMGCATEPLYRVMPDGVERVLGPSGVAITRWRHAAFGRDGSLWVIAGDSLLWRDRAGGWQARAASDFHGDRLYRIYAAGSENVFLATDRALFELAPSGRTLAVDSLAYVMGARMRADGSTVILTNDGRIYERRDRTLRCLHVDRRRGTDLALRGDAIWAVTGAALIVLRPPAPPETVAPVPGLPAGRALLVDREGSLWLGGLLGLYQLPEPDAVTWSEIGPPGSPPAGRFVERTEEGVWFGTWAGLALVPDREGSRELRIIDPNYRWRVAPDRWGHVWAGGLYGFHDRGGGGDRLYRVDTGADSLLRVCASSHRPDSTLWITTSSGMFLTPRQDRVPPRVVPGTPPPGWGSGWHEPWVVDAVEDGSGALWVTNGEQICHAPAESVAMGAPVRWRCQTIEDVESVTDLAEMPSGAMWCGTNNGGILRVRDGVWEPIPGARSLSTPRAQWITPSPRGGVWIGGSGNLLRVEEDLRSPDGWRVLERPSTWEGIPNPSASEVREEANGDLWIAGIAGLTHVPHWARLGNRVAPSVQLVEVLVDGRHQSPVGPLRLPFDRNRVELRFAAMSYRDPSLIRYQVRVRPGAPWMETRDPNFRFVDLPPGQYRAEIRASLDGEQWSSTPAMVAFQVLRPWYLEWWALSLAVALASATVYAVYRVRVGFLLRLERQRAQIAMDLHDEMGSGLGSIGLLAGLAATDDIDEANRRHLVRQIADAASELGGSLSDMVWSLRRDSGTIEALAVRLAERGARLFPDDEETNFVTAFPAEWPNVVVPLEVRRNLQLIASEALHNAARHARARRVELGFERDGGAWRMWVLDDGRGLSPSGAHDDRGNGLRNLRARARSIGAVYSLDSAPGRGTKVEVVVDVAGRGHRQADRRRRRPR